MNQVLKLLFRHKAVYYSIYVTVVNEFETCFVFVEFLDDTMIDIFNTDSLSYKGEKGYKRLQIYKSVYAQPILLSISSMIKNACRICNEYNGEKQNEDFIRQN